MDIRLMRRGDPYWEKTAAFARACSWKAGPVLAQRMTDGGFLDWERVIAAVEHENVAGFCTLSEKDELPGAYPFSPFIGFLFVDEKYRGKRLSGKMIDHALRYAKELGYGKVYVMSGEQGLYEKYGFVKIGDYETIYGTVDQLFQRNC